MFFKIQIYKKILKLNHSLEFTKIVWVPPNFRAFWHPFVASPPHAFLQPVVDQELATTIGANIAMTWGYPSCR